MPAGSCPGPRPTPPPTELAAFLPSVEIERSLADDASASEIAAVVAGALDGVDVVVLPASPNGRDLAGALSALTGLGVLANAVGVAAGDGGPVTTHSVFGGKLITEGAFAGGRGHRHGPAQHGQRRAAGHARARSSTGAAARSRPSRRSALVERVEAEGAAVSIDDARIIVSGGRGVGGPEGFGLVEELAGLLGGAVGASRAAVDSGWIPYSQQIGQTGKIVKPQLYLALGISGAIQHKVGMQTAGAIVAVNRDPDAPIADFADVVVVGDLFEVGRALADQLRARSG